MDDIHIEHLRLILESGHRTLYRNKIGNVVHWIIQAGDGGDIVSDIDLTKCLDKFMELYFS